MNETAIDGNIYYTNNGFFERGKVNSKFKDAYFEDEVTYLKGMAIKKTIRTIKNILDFVLEDSKRVHLYANNPEQLDALISQY